MLDGVLHVLVTLLLPPLLLGVINRTKALIAGRRGPPLLQPYFELAKLWRKGSVTSRTTSWIFRAGPVVGLAGTLAASLLLPLGAHPCPISFTGDLILFAYLFALGRFFTAAAALDTGSAFEGMGSAREVTFSALAEPALFFGLLVLAKLSGALSLEPMMAAPAAGWLTAGASLVLVVVSLFIVLLAENCRVPFDDPNTHLELTMIHEVMVLDHGGPYLGFILYGAALKLFVLSALLLRLILPVSLGEPALDWGLFAVGMVALAAVIGVVESVMARLRLLRVPQLLLTASILSALALILLVR